jgi:CheY-like chemotaxis protein/HPt (histidine-containing phosphotransfer) domain-containing protein
MPLPDNIAPADLPQSSRILLVEDHDVNRLLGTEMLERCGQEVSIAQDGNEAIAMVIDSMVRAKPFDLVFMDIQMPGCDGYAATRAIRGEGIEAETLPIIALTANAFPEDIAAAREAGMQGHLAKPLVFADLARTLQRWLPTRIIEAPATIVGGQAADETRRDEDAGGAAAGSDPVTEAARAQRDGEAATSPPNGDMANAPMSPAPFIPPQSHSPALLARWNARRTEAIEAVRAALEDGVLAENGGTAEARDELARLVHKLAGTAAMFGEAKLGEQAAAFEHALRMKLPADARETLAFALLAMAHGPEEALAPAAD